MFECESLVIDFVMSGEGPIVEPKIEKQSGRETGGTKPDVGTVPNPDVKTPASPQVPASSNIPPSAGDPSESGQHRAPSVELPPEVLTMFQQLGVDVSSFPPELIIMAHSIIMGEQITETQLARARFCLSVAIAVDGYLQGNTLGSGTHDGSTVETHAVVSGAVGAVCRDSHRHQQDSTR